MRALNLALGLSAALSMHVVALVFGARAGVQVYRDGAAHAADLLLYLVFTAAGTSVVAVMGRDGLFGRTHTKG